MNCFYCDKIAATDPAYVTAAAAFDLGSDAPRCGKHWRYVCGQCNKPAHFMAVAFCPETGKCFCARCATGRREVEAQFWAWKYYLCQWGNFDPVLSFHRPLRDYWEAFTGAGFSVDAFEEPSITERGRRELPQSRVEQALRVPYSCIFRLRKP